MPYFLAALALLMPLALSPFGLSWGYAGAFAVKQTLLETGALLLLIFWPGLLLPPKGQTRPAYLIMALFAAYVMLHTALLGSAYAGAASLYTFLCGVLVFLGAMRVAQEEHALRRMFTALASAGGIAGAWGLAQYFSGIEPFSTLGNRNLLAGFLLFAIPAQTALLYQARCERKMGNFVLSALALGVSLAALLLCRSKASWLALASAGAVLLPLCLRKPRLGFFALLIAAFLLLFLPVERMVAEFYRDVRPFLWNGTWNMVLDRPWTGWGLGAFFVYFPLYRPADYFLMDKSADTTLHAHNEFLQLAAETGLPGLLLFVSLTVVVLLRLIRSLRAEQSSGPCRALGGALLFMLLASAVKSFFDMDMRTPAGLFFFWLALGLAAGYGAKQDAAQEVARASVFLRSAAASLALILFWQFTLPFARAEFLAKQALNAQKAGDWPRAQGAYEKAMRVYRYSVDYPFQLGYAYARAGQWDNALRMYEHVRQTAPYYSNVLFNMAAICRQQGDYEKALSYLREGFAVNPYSLQGHDIAREIFLLTGQTHLARREDMLLQMIVSVKTRYRDAR